MCILKFLLKINFNIALLRQHSIPNAGTNPSNTGLFSESSFFGSGFLNSQKHLLQCLLRSLTSFVQWDQVTVISKSEYPLPILP